MLGQAELESLLQVCHYPFSGFLSTICFPASPSLSLLLLLSEIIKREAKCCYEQVEEVKREGAEKCIYTLNTARRGDTVLAGAQVETGAQVLNLERACQAGWRVMLMLVLLAADVDLMTTSPLLRR